jgi:hypothetical protein
MTATTKAHFCYWLVGRNHVGNGYGTAYFERTESWRCNNYIWCGGNVIKVSKEIYFIIIITTTTVFQGLGLLACFGSEFIF